MFKDIRRILAPFVLLACNAAVHAQQVAFEKINIALKDYGYINTQALWRERTVPVCFENIGSSDRENALIVEKAIEESWELASGIQFTGWQSCRRDSRGIRILISDDNTAPHSLYGNTLDGVVNGMKLNFTFKNWGQSCQTQASKCITSIAVHEFGHAIGFVHESLREDAPAECKARADVVGDGSKPTESQAITTYDPDSVMNYCNFVYNNNGILSEKDKLAALSLYPKR